MYCYRNAYNRDASIVRCIVTPLKPAHPLRLNIGTLQNLPSCFHTSRFKSKTSIHCQRPLQKHVNNHIDNVNGVTFVTRKHMSPQGPIFHYYHFILPLVCILPQVCSLHFTLSLHFTPGLHSAVCSLQSAFYTDRLTFTCL